MTRAFLVAVLLVGIASCDGGAPIPPARPTECLPLAHCHCFACVAVVCDDSGCTDADEGRMGAEGYVFRQSEGGRRYLERRQLTESCHAPCPASEPPRCVREAGSCRRAASE